jgi:hypothetical protein
MLRAHFSITKNKVTYKNKVIILKGSHKFWWIERIIINALTTIKMHIYSWCKMCIGVELYIVYFL